LYDAGQKGKESDTMAVVTRKISNGKTFEHYQEVSTGRYGGEELFLTKLVHVHQAEKAFKENKTKNGKGIKR
jgi:hypothetical protein